MKSSRETGDSLPREMQCDVCMHGYVCVVCFSVCGDRNLKGSLSNFYHHPNFEWQQHEHSNSQG